MIAIDIEYLRDSLTRKRRSSSIILLITILMLSILACALLSSVVFPVARNYISVIELTRTKKQETLADTSYVINARALSVYMENFPEIPGYTKNGIDLSVHEAVLQESEEHTVTISGLEVEVASLKSELELISKDYEEIKTAIAELNEGIKTAINELDEISSNLAEEIIVLQTKNDEYEKELERLKNNRATVPVEIAHQPQEQLEFLGEFTMTAYCNCVQCCGQWSPHHSSRVGTSYVQRTAGGYIPTVGLTVAVDRSVVPLGTWLYIEGYGVRQAQDTGSAVKGKWIDMYTGSHEEALQIGRRKVDVWIISPP